MNVKSWLRRLPHPVRVRLDRKKELRVAEQGKNKWRDLVDAITLEQPSVIEALDADGVVIRMTELADADAKGEDDAKPEKSPDWNQLMVPAGLVQHFAELYAQAYTRGAEQHARAYELAFGENTKLVTALSSQARSLQTSLEAQLAARLEMAEAGGEGGMSDLMSGPLGPMLMAMAQKHLLPSGEMKNGKSSVKKG